MFFDEYPRFLDTSETASGRNRLNMRHEAIITDNLDVLSGARVLDLASHDGRWSFAALKAGASHVVGIEAREHLVVHGRQSFAAEGVDPASFELRHSDMFAALRDGGIEVDVVMCLGFLYHTLRYNELLHGMRATGAKHIIVDSTVNRRRDALVVVRREPNKRDAMAAVDEYTLGDQTLSGVPSVAALQEMFSAYGFEQEKQCDWKELTAAHPEVEPVRQYLRGDRMTGRWVRVG